jgi:probable rRNA maturation factor
MTEGEYGSLNPNLLGDVVLSVDTTGRQAEEGGFTLEEMLDFFLIHGILHLAGYDHLGSAEEAERMDARTWELWESLGHVR